MSYHYDPSLLKIKMRFWRNFVENNLKKHECLSGLRFPTIIFHNQLLVVRTYKLYFSTKNPICFFLKFCLFLFGESGIISSTTPPPLDSTVQNQVIVFNCWLYIFKIFLHLYLDVLSVRKGQFFDFKLGMMIPTTVGYNLQSEATM